MDAAFKYIEKFGIEEEKSYRYRAHVSMGVNPGGDGGDASPPLFGVGGTPILIVPPTFCQGWIQV